MKILFSPCHYIFAPNSGSESSWSYEIASRISTKYPKCVVITGFGKSDQTNSQKNSLEKLQNSNQNYQIIELQPEKKVVDMSLKNALLFNWQYFVKTRELLADEKSENQNSKLNPKFQIIHHCLPFAIGSTYNLAAILGYFKDKKFVIGPLQTGLNYKDTDVNPSNFRSSISNSKSRFSVTNLLTNFLAQITKPILAFLSHQTLLKADKIIVINQATQKFLLEQKIPADKIQIINPGLDITKFKFRPKIDKKIDENFEEVGQRIETQNQIEEKDRIFEIVSVGYLLKRKGLDLLIEAVKQLKTELLDLQNEQKNEINQDQNNTQNTDQNWQKTKIHLNILGDGPQMENLKKLVLDYKLSENVTFVGFVDNSQVPRFYQKADVFVSMSRSESWGQMYLEAMACGVPIITTENVGSSEIIEHNQTGILVPQESVDELVQNLRFMIQDPTKKIEIIQNARQELEQKYDWNKIIGKYEKVYQDLLDA